jgi:hypothetical protein
LEFFFPKAVEERYRYDSADASVFDVIPQLFELGVFGETLSRKCFSKAREFWEVG